MNSCSYRKIVFTVSLSLIFLSRQLVAVPCSASSTTCDEYIYQVQVGSINNNGTGCSNYADYTSSYSTTMQPGTSYPITIVGAVGGQAYTGYDGDQLGIWVDWNGDDDFSDTGETVYTVTNYGYFTTTITPPAGTSSGNKRMRIRLTYTGTLSPCGTTSYGEVEDYRIVIPSVNNGKISGTKFHDTNGNSKWDTGEPGIAGWEIYLDTNGNKSWNTGEPKTTTNSSGYYEFAGLAAGSYTVTEVQQTGWHQTFPDNEGRYTESLSSGSTLTDRNFGNRQISGTLITIPATADTYASSSNPDTNYGTQNGFSCGKSSTTTTRSFLKFNLSVIPAGQVVTRAKLRLENSYISIPAPELAASLTSDDWEETALNWNNQPRITSEPGTLPNTQVISGSITVWDVTTTVDNQYIGDGYYSVILKSTDETVTKSASFWSKDLGWAPMAPKLEVEYAPMAGGGIGSPEDSYQIWTGEQMNRIGLYKNRWNKNYKLMTDISLAAYTGSAYNIVGRSSSTSNGNGPFVGTFDGNNHSISGFSCSRTNTSYVGLFGYVGENGMIKNLKVLSPNLIDTGLDDMSYVGPIAGFVGNADILGCAVIGGTVQGKNCVGGLVGASFGFISACSSSAAVSGVSSVGGFAGGQYGLGSMGNISDCYARGNITGSSYVGGFIGDSSDITIVNCYSTGTVSGSTNTGGFSGYNSNQYLYGKINTIGCFWDVTASGVSQSAVGTPLLTVDMQNINSYLGAGWDFVNEITNGGSNNWAMPAGGGYPVLWYELLVTPSLPSFSGGAGTVGAPYLIETIDQLNSIANNSRLIDKHFKLESDLDFSNRKFYLIAERPYIFTGTFDGAGYTIHNLLIEPVFKTSSAGFIGTLKGTSASIKNLMLIDPNVDAGMGFGVGSLAGRNFSGTISNCHALNSRVWGWASVGGLVGNNYMYASISNCSASAQIAENTFLDTLFSAAGGLVGENSFYSKIENSYAKCIVSGNDCVGGIAGSNLIYSTIKNCYATGNVVGTGTYIGGFIGRNIGATRADICYSSVSVSGPSGTDSVGGFVGKMSTSGCIYTACYWNNELNGAMPGIGNKTDPNVFGKTTAEMKSLATFTGWDFVDTWAICEGTNYPRLQWQIPAGDWVCPDGVRMEDFAFLAGHWMETTSEADLSGDGVVGIEDLVLFGDNWLEGL